MPGRYYLVAGQGRMEDFRETSDLSRRNEVVDKYPFTFFPGVTEFEKAHTIDVPAGGELGPSDFTLARPQQYRIRARVIDPATGKAPSRVIVVIGYWTTNGQGSMASPGYYNAQTGMIELNNLVPGAYSVGATLYDGGTVPNSVFSRGAPGPSAAARFFIVDSDIDAPPLTLAAPSVITGRIRLDGQPSDSTPLNSVQISFLPPTEEIAISPEAGLRPIMAFPRKDGTFTANIPHSAIRVMVSELPAGFYVKEVKLDGADALSDAAPVSRPGELEIVLSSKAGRIDGVVKDERLQPAAGVQTVLIPVERRNHPELYKEVTTDLSGRFSISGVPPGGYKLFAWEDLEPYTYFDPEVLEKFEQKGQPVHVSESSHLTLDVRVIPGGNE
jgi:hypothetical protein